MGKQKGLIVLEGTIGGLNFYIRKGEALVRAAGGGFNGDAIKKKPSMVRVRENGSEFGGCMQVTKHFKMGIRPLLVLFRDGMMHQRLVQLFTRIKDCDLVSERGKRHVGQGILTATGKDLLNGYCIATGASLSTVLRQSYRFEWGLEGFVIDDFSVSRVAFPKGATHLELIVGCLDFDFTSFATSFCKSEPLLVSKDFVGSRLVLAPSAMPEGNGTKMGVVFLRFFQEINGVFYPLKETDSVVMEVVFVG
jgi:hypothetical protein